MAQYARNKKRTDLIFTACNQYLYYGFKPKDLVSFAGINADDILALGHLQSTSIPEGGLRIIGAKSPKPPRVKKKIPNATVGQQQSVSTYCGFDKIATAQAKGWTLIENRKTVNLAPPLVNTGSLTAIATLSNSSLYCFPMNKADFDEFGSTLGLKSSIQITSELLRGKLVSGCTSPKPGKALKQLPNNSTFISFYSDAKQDDLQSDGWLIKSQEIILESGTPF